jgi:maltokinase
VIDEGGLAHALVDHLARQRWFNRSSSAEGVQVARQEVLVGSWPGMARIELDHRGVRYQLVVGWRRVDECGVADVGEAAAIGIVDVGGEPAFCYDALVDGDLALALGAIVVPDEHLECARRITAEQTNTSLVYDERLIFKVFRRLYGANPDVEVTTALAAAGFDRVPAPAAVWRSGDDDLGLMQRFLPGATDGWALALTSVRDLVGAGVGTDPAEAGADFGAEAARLGQLTAGMHQAMASAFGTAPGDAQAWADMVASRMRAVVHPQIDPAAVDAIVDRLRHVTDVGASVRVHGDFHLGQVLFTDAGWYVSDFEGEPLRPTEERRRPTSPLRDVAGMLRSFDYAAHAVVMENANDDDAVALAQSWEQRNRAKFLEAYESTMAGTPLLPSDPESRRTVLAAFELDKALYEVAYEQAHRPDWLPIPLAGVRRLLGSSVVSA